MLAHHTLEVKDSTEDTVVVRVMEAHGRRYIGIERPDTAETIISLYPTRTEVLRLVTALLDLL